MGLKAKIKDYMNDASIDVFGYEKKVTENISNYLLVLAEQHKISKFQVCVRISQPKDKLKAHLYYLDSSLKEISFKELLDFFLGEGTSVLFDMENKIRHNVMKYFFQYAQEKKLPLHTLNIVISQPSDSILAVAYKQTEVIENIPLKELIKYFKG